MDLGGMCVRYDNRKEAKLFNNRVRRWGVAEKHEGGALDMLVTWYYCSSNERWAVCNDNGRVDKWMLAEVSEESDQSAVAVLHRWCHANWPWVKEIRHRAEQLLLICLVLIGSSWSKKNSNIFSWGKRPAVKGTYQRTDTVCPVTDHCLHEAEAPPDGKSAALIDPGQMNKWEREEERGGRGGMLRSLIFSETECCHTSPPAFSPLPSDQSIPSLCLLARHYCCEWSLPLVVWDQHSQDKRWWRWAGGGGGEYGWEN